MLIMTNRDLVVDDFGILKAGVVVEVPDHLLGDAQGVQGLGLVEGQPFGENSMLTRDTMLIEFSKAQARLADKDGVLKPGATATKLVKYKGDGANVSTPGAEQVWFSDAEGKPLGWTKTRKDFCFDCWVVDSTKPNGKRPVKQRVLDIGEAKQAIKEALVEAKLIDASTEPDATDE